MKCPACGRRMVNRTTYLECPNILCDYEEDIEDERVLVKPEPIKTCITFDKFGSDPAVKSLAESLCGRRHIADLQ